MRETFSSLILASQNLITDASSSNANISSGLSDTLTFIKKEINKTVRFMYAALKNYKTQQYPKTASTVASQTYYHYPPGVQSIESATLEVSDVYYLLTIIESQHQWDLLNQIDFSGSILPQFIFPRSRDFGIWPTPQEDDLTITLNANPIPKDMTAVDYTTGTIAVTQNDATITGTDTTFTSAMVGRWFKADDDGDWYKLATFTSTTSMELESVFEGSTDTSSTYIIGESPDLPEELHELIPYRVAAIYLAGPKRDPKTAQTFMNFFYTGDFGNDDPRINKARGGFNYFLNEYRAKGRGNTPFINRRNPRISRFSSDIWGSTLS